VWGGRGNPLYAHFWPISLGACIWSLSALLLAFWQSKYQCKLKEIAGIFIPTNPAAHSPLLFSLLAGFHFRKMSRTASGATCPKMQQTKCFAFKAPRYSCCTIRRISKDTAGHRDGAGSSGIFWQKRTSSSAQKSMKTQGCVYMYMPPLHVYQRGWIAEFRKLTL